MNERDMQAALMACRWDHLNYLALPNVSPFTLAPWEIDLLVVSKAGAMYEVEIKCSVADLRADAKKHTKAEDRMKDWHGGDYRDRFRERWYALTSEVWRKVQDDPPIPPECGILVVSERCGPYQISTYATTESGRSYDLSRPIRILDRRRFDVEVARPAKVNRKAKPIDEQLRVELMRLLAIRFWSYERRRCGYR